MPLYCLLYEFSSIVITLLGASVYFGLLQGLLYVHRYHPFSHMVILVSSGLLTVALSHILMFFFCRDIFLYSTFHLQINQSVNDLSLMTVPPTKLLQKITYKKLTSISHFTEIKRKIHLSLTAKIQRYASIISNLQTIIYVKSNHKKANISKVFVVLACVSEYKANLLHRRAQK